MTGTLLLLGVVIGANNLAVALALGVMGQRAKRLRIVAVFGLFEFVMPLMGIWLGRRIAETLATNLSWLAPALLIGFGLTTLLGAALRSFDHKALGRRAASWGGLVLLATSLSMDNLLIGLSFGLSDVAPVTLAAVISVFSMLFTSVGLWTGHRIARRGRRRAKAGAGMLLILAGLWLLHPLF